MKTSPRILFRTLSRKWRKRVEQAGARDGRRAVPGLEDPRVADFELLLKQEADEALHSLSHRLQADDARLCRAFAGARSDYVATRKRYLERREQLGDRPVQVEIGALAYWAIILLIIACELPINLRVFLDLFPDSNLMSFLAAGSLTAVLLVLSHFCGKAFHQQRQRGIGALAVLLAIGIVLGLAYLRQVFFAHPEDPSELARAFGFIAPEMLTAFFVFINAALIVLGVWLGMKRHDPDQTYEQRWREYQRARSRAIRLADRRAEQQARYREAAGGAISMLRKLLGRYREVNMDNREIKATPRAWVEQPIEQLISADGYPLDIPANDLELD